MTNDVSDIFCEHSLQRCKSSLVVLSPGTLLYSWRKDFWLSFLRSLMITFCCCFAVTDPIAQEETGFLTLSEICRNDLFCRVYWWLLSSLSLILVDLCDKQLRLWSHLLPQMKVESRDKQRKTRSQGNERNAKTRRPDTSWSETSQDHDFLLLKMMNRLRCNRDWSLIQQSSSSFRSFLPFHLWRNDDEGDHHLLWLEGFPLIRFRNIHCSSFSLCILLSVRCFGQLFFVLFFEIEILKVSLFLWFSFDYQLPPPLEVSFRPLLTTNHDGLL